MKFAGVGFEFAAAVGVCGYLGYWADRYWRIEPWGLLMGLGLGFVAGLYQLVRTAQSIDRESRT